jgi:SulP family sulfate permease
VLAGVESLLSAVVADGMIGGKHRSNMELVAQGIANVFSGLFGGIPATGAIARTAANIRNGGRTPIAGIIHSLTVLAVMMILMPLAKLIPMTTLAAILMVVAYNMSEWHAFKNLFKAPKTDIAILLVTFVLTVVVDLVVAIEFGIVMAAFLFMKRMADITKVESIKQELEDHPDIALNNPEGIDPAIQIFQIYGPFFFGAADKFAKTIQENDIPTRVMIVRMKHVPFMDATAYHALFKVYSYCRKRRILVLFTHVQKQPYELLERHSFIDLAGRDNFCDNIESALVRANAYIELHKKFPSKKLAI